MAERVREMFRRKSARERRESSTMTVNLSLQAIDYLKESMSHYGLRK